MTDTTQTEQQLQTETGKRETVTVTETGEVIAIADLIIRGVSPDEQEATIVIERTSPVASVYVSDNVTLTKIRRILSNADTEWKVTRIERCNGDICGVFLSCPKKRVALHSKARIISDEHKAAIVNGVKSYRAGLEDGFASDDDFEDEEEE